MQDITQIKKCPLNGKRSFTDEQEAAEFEKSNREKYGNPLQYPYPCEDCSAWHLSSSPNGNSRIARVHMPVETAAPSGGRKGIETSEVIRLKESGLTAQEIADRLGISTPSVYYHLNKVEVKESPSLVTYEQHRDRRIQLEADITQRRAKCESEVALVQEEINRIKPIEDRLFEERQLKVGYGTDGTVILCKNGRQFNLTQEEIGKLFAEVTDPANAGIKTEAA